MKPKFLIAALVLLAASPAWATTLIRKDFDRQAVEADLIVVGRPIAREEVSWHGYPCTRVTVRVEEVIDGEKVGAQISLIQPGAARFQVLGVRHLRHDADYLLLLEKLPDGYYRLVGFNQGAHSIAIERASGRKVVTTHKGRGAGPGMTLEAAKNRIFAVRARARNDKAPK